MRLKEGGQPGTVAAGAFHRPAAPSWHPHLGKRQQALVAGRIGAYCGLAEHPADRVCCSCGEGVAVEVDAGTRGRQLVTKAARWRLIRCGSCPGAGRRSLTAILHGRFGRLTDSLTRGRLEIGQADRGRRHLSPWFLANLLANGPFE